MSRPYLRLLSASWNPHLCQLCSMVVKGSRNPRALVLQDLKWGL